MNLLSVGAAYGVMTLVAKGGAVGGLIGIDHEVPIAPFMPVMMFAILFGLSMDYEVFLISRIREEYLKHGDTRRAVADGLAKTARVITAAAAIMVVVFLAFVAAPDVFLKLFGIGLATAIFLDATIVRMVLVPAVMQLLGNRNWWIPDWLERILPRLDVERVAVGAARDGPSYELRGHREQPPFVGESLQHLGSPVHERNARSGKEILDGARDEHFARPAKAPCAPRCGQRCRPPRRPSARPRRSEGRCAPPAPGRGPPPCWRARTGSRGRSVEGGESRRPRC